MSIFESQKEALEFLKAAHVFYSNDPDPDEPEIDRCINMNDTFMWALAYGPHVSDDQLITVAGLFWRYGSAGLCYWCTIHPDEEDRMICSEFEDIQRGIDFVRHEEKLRLSGKSSSECAYYKLSYTLGNRRKWIGKLMTWLGA